MLTIQPAKEEHVEMLLQRVRVANEHGNVMALSEIAGCLNGTVNGRWINVRGPHHSAADRSLGILFDPKAPDGFRIYSFAGDDEENCRAHVKSLIHKLNGHLFGINEPERDPSEGLAARTKRATDLWQEGISPIGTPAETNLNSRRCTLPSTSGDDVIRFHPVCQFGSLRVPAMLALIRDVVSEEPIGVQRTALRDDGLGKRFGADSRRILGVARRGAVRLQPTSAHLGIAEGIETALSATQLFKTPVWATLSSGGIANFPVLPGIKLLTVFADHDPPGMTAAVTCCRRYNAAGIDAEIRRPSRPGTDWNDYLTRETN